MNEGPRACPRIKVGLRKVPRVVQVGICSIFPPIKSILSIQRLV